MNSEYILAAVLVYLVNEWASVEMDRRDGNISIEDQVMTFNASAFPVGKIVERLITDPEVGPHILDLLGEVGHDLTVSKNLILETLKNEESK